MEKIGSESFFYGDLNFSKEVGFSVFACQCLRCNFGGLRCPLHLYLDVAYLCATKDNSTVHDYPQKMFSKFSCHDNYSASHHHLPSKISAPQ